MKISVIVPVYNASKYINKLIESVINQTYQNFELILVDDGSKDNSYEIIKIWENKNNKIKVFTKKNTGPGYTRKFGFEKSTGDLIFFVDSDDWITNNSVFQQIVDIFNKNNIIDVLFFDREDIVGKQKDIIKGFEKINSGYHKMDELNDFVRPGLGTKILKKEILTPDIFIESNIFEDLYTTYMYLDKCKNFYYVNKCFYTIYHDEHSISLSSVKNVNDVDTYEKSINIVLELYSKLNNETLKYSLSLRMAHIFIKYIRKYKDSSNVELRNKVYKIVKILKENKIPFIPLNNKKKILKKVYYFIFLNIQYRRIKHEK